MVTVVVIGLQVVAMCTWVAVLYFGYFYIQSTEMEAWRQVLLNGLNSTIWGISLEFLNFIIFYKVNLTLTPSLTLTLNLTLTCAALGAALTPSSAATWLGFGFGLGG